MAARVSAAGKSVRNSFWSVLDAAVYPVVYMAMIPVMMNGLGPTVFGLWIVLNTLMTTLQLFNLNIGLTTIKKLSGYAAAGDERKLNLALNAILRITLLLIAGVSCIGLLIAFVLPHYNFLGIDSRIAGNVTACIVLAALITGTKYLDQVFQSVLKAFERYRSAAILNLFNRLGLLSVNVMLAVRHSSVQELLLANIAFTLLYLLVHFLFISRSLPMLHFSLGDGRLLTGSVLSFSMWPWFQSIIVVIAFQTDRFWVSSYSGLEEVSSYGIVATMFNHIHMIFAAMAAWALPRISAMVARGDNPQATYDQIRGILFSVAITTLVVFNYCAPALFTFWIGGEAYRGMSVYIEAFTIFELLFVHTIMPFFYLNAAGKERAATRVTFFYSLGCYVMMIAGLHVFKEPLFMIHGMSLSLCVSMPVVNYFVKRQLSGTASVKRTIAEMLPVYLAILMVWLPQSWVGLLLIPLIAVFLYQYYLLPIVEQRLWRLPVKL
jgi:O-antigen/teichoic acid export membrane protein